MTDFKKELITKLEYDVPELRNKIQAGAVDEKTEAPYAAFTTPDEQPIRTIDGIAGYVTTFEIAVFHTKFSAVENLKHAVINSLERAELSDKICYLKSSEYAFYPEYNIHGYTITFKII